MGLFSCLFFSLSFLRLLASSFLVLCKFEGVAFCHSVKPGNDHVSWNSCWYSRFIRQKKIIPDILQLVEGALVEFLTHILRYLAHIYMCVWNVHVYKFSGSSLYFYRQCVIYLFTQSPDATSITWCDCSRWGSMTNACARLLRHVSSGLIKLEIFSMSELKKQLHCRLECVNRGTMTYPFALAWWIGIIFSDPCPLLPL